MISSLALVALTILEACLKVLKVIKDLDVPNCPFPEIYHVRGPVHLYLRALEAYHVIIYGALID